MCFLGIGEEEGGEEGEGEGKYLIGYHEFWLNKSCRFDKCRVKIDLALDLNKSARGNARRAPINYPFKS